MTAGEVLEIVMGEFAITDLGSRSCGESVDSVMKNVVVRRQAQPQPRRATADNPLSGQSSASASGVSVSVRRCNVVAVVCRCYVD